MPWKEPCVWKRISRKSWSQRTKHLQNPNIFFINKVTIIHPKHFYFLQLNSNNLIDILTKINKINIDCFKPIISVGSTLTHVRYYLDDPVHLLVSGTSCKKFDLQFVHQVFGAVAGDCLSLNNWRWILLLRLGKFCLLGQSLLFSFQKFF